MKSNKFSFEFDGKQYDVLVDRGEPFFFRMRPFPSYEGAALGWMVADDLPKSIVEQARYIYHEGI